MLSVLWVQRRFEGCCRQQASGLAGRYNGAMDGAMDRPAGWEGTQPASSQRPMGQLARSTQEQGDSKGKLAAQWERKKDFAARRRDPLRAGKAEGLDHELQFLGFSHSEDT